MKKLLTILIVTFLYSDIAYAIIYTKSGNIDVGLAIIWSGIVIGIIWFVAYSWLTSRPQVYSRKEEVDFLKDKIENLEKKIKKSNQRKKNK